MQPLLAFAQIKGGVLEGSNPQLSATYNFKRFTTFTWLNRFFIAFSNFAIFWHITQKILLLAILTSTFLIVSTFSRLDSFVPYYLKDEKHFKTAPQEREQAFVLNIPLRYKPLPSLAHKLLPRHSAILLRGQKFQD